MPLNGTGAIMGAAILAATGNPDPAAVPIFATLGDTIGAWAITNMNCTAGTMVSAGAAVSGFGALEAVSDEEDLGRKLAVAMQDPSAAGISTWTKFAKALIEHMERYGQVNPAGFVAPSPGGGPLTGTGLVSFTNLVIPLPTALDVTDAVAGALLLVFGTQILSHIASTATVVPLTTNTPFIPYTAPPGGGTITGAGAIT